MHALKEKNETKNFQFIADLRLLVKLLMSSNYQLEWHWLFLGIWTEDPFQSVKKTKTNHFFVPEVMSTRE